MTDPESTDRVEEPEDISEQEVRAELDRLLQLSSNSQRWLAQYQAKLSQETSISSLKVSFNRVFGYYIEVTDAHRAKVPTAWTRRQTVRNAERYITAELKKFEEEATGARDRAVALEQELFEKVRLELLPHVPAMQELAKITCQNHDNQRSPHPPGNVDQPVFPLVDGALRPGWSKKE